MARDVAGESAYNGDALAACPAVPPLQLDYEPDQDELDRMRYADALTDVIRAVLKQEPIPADAVQALGGQLDAGVWAHIARAQRTVSRMSRGPLSPDTLNAVVDEVASRESWGADPWEKTFVFAPVVRPLRHLAPRVRRPRARARRRRAARARSPGRQADDPDRLDDERRAA